MGQKNKKTIRVERIFLIDRLIRILTARPWDSLGWIDTSWPWNSYGSEISNLAEFSVFSIPYVALPLPLRWDGDEFSDRLRPSGTIASIIELNAQTLYSVYLHAVANSYEHVCSRQMDQSTFQKYSYAVEPISWSFLSCILEQKYLNCDSLVFFGSFYLEEGIRAELSGNEGISPSVVRTVGEMSENRLTW